WTLGGRKADGVDGLFGCLVEQLVVRRRLCVCVEQQQPWRAVSGGTRKKMIGAAVGRGGCEAERVVVVVELGTKKKKEQQPWRFGWTTRVVTGHRTSELGCSTSRNAAALLLVNGGRGVDLGGLMDSSGELGALDQGRWIHTYIINNREIVMSVSLGTALIDMYAKCGCIEFSSQLFKNMPQRDVVTWGVIISGFAIHGQAKKCFQLFDEMIESGVKPNGVMFVAILSACSHA
uniref:Pentatricopeptide repeat-containing protein At4g38010-like n=1 Tax=Nicotiana sylvestris TaxID=4096 RepID=A0A1U7UZ39_NICSY